MRILSWFRDSIHPIIVHDGIRIFRCNQLALDLFGYKTAEQLYAAGIASIVSQESKWLSARRVEQLRKHPDENLPDAQLCLVRCDGSQFTATVHTKTLRWAFLEDRDMDEIIAALETDIVFYSWCENVKEVIS